MGNAVSFIQSVFYVFGSGVIVPGTGVLFNNRLTGFSLDPASPNVLAPGKRTAHTLNAYIVTREQGTGNREQQEGASAAVPFVDTDTAMQNADCSLFPVPCSLAFVGGTPGADVQVQSNLQVICNVIDYGMNPQEAIEAPRWQHGPVVTDGTGTPEELAQEHVALEERITPDVKAELERRGHDTAWIGPWAHSSSYQLIAVDPDTGAYLGGSDPRCDGHAAGF